MEQLLEKHICGTYQRRCLSIDSRTFPSIMQSALIKDMDGRDLVWMFVEDISKEKNRRMKFAICLS